MKYLKVIAIATILSLGVADSYGAGWFQEWRSDQQQRQMKRHKHNKRRQKHQDRVVQQPPTPVGAPIDGGLLTILGAAGVAYYTARRNKKKDAQ